MVRRGEEGVDHFPLADDIGVGGMDIGSAYPAPGPASELPRRGRGTPHHGGDLVEGQVEHVVQDERQPLRGGQRVQHHVQRQPDRVGQQRLILGGRPVRAADDRVGNVHAHGLLTPLRERSTFRHTRATIVVSQPPRFSTPLASDRLRRNILAIHAVFIRR